MLNKIMKKRDWLIFSITAILVFFLYQIVMTCVNTTNSVQTSDLINNSQVSPEELYDISWRTVKKNYIDSSYNSQDWKRWRTRYKGKLKTDEDARVAIETMVASLDDTYTRFLSKAEYAEQYNSIDSHITGIGVHIMSQSGKTVVYGVIEDTPASRADIRVNDIILYVDGVSVSGLDISKVAEKVRGAENTYVTLKIKRGNNIITKKVIRKKIEIKSVESSVKDGNIGYIRIKSFIGTNTAAEFLNALKRTDNTDGLIIDLRGNTGGLLTNAVVVANMFINNGTIVSIVSKSGRKNDISAQMNVQVIQKPTVVLVDEASASASEILSGALKDNKKAVLVGTKTFGKGLVQQIVPLPNGTGLNITIAKYLTPNGSDIHQKGIEPDYKVEYSINDMRNHNDTQLKKAEAVIKSMYSKPQ